MTFQRSTNAAVVIITTMDMAVAVAIMTMNALAHMIMRRNVAADTTTATNL